MALPRRAQREVYTVFNESDFMAGTEAADMFTPDATSEQARRRVGRLAGPALMAAVLAAIVVTLLAHRAPGPASGRPDGAPGPRQASKPGQTRVRQASLPAPLLVSEQSHTDLAARRPTLGTARASRTVAPSSRVPGETSREGASGPAAPSETPEFGFER